MKKIQIIIIFILTLSYLYPENNKVYDQAVLLENNTIHYVFENKVNIRAEANQNSKVLAQAVIGDKIKIIQKTDIKQKLYGLNAYWYKIEFNKITGYLWGGLISTIEIEADFNNDNKNEILMSRALTHGDYYYSEYMVDYKHSYKLCTNGLLISDDPFEKKPVESNSTFNVLKDLGFKPDIILLNINWSFGDGPAGSSQNELYYLLDDKFILVYEYENYVNPGEDVIFEILYPKDNKKNNIIEIYKKTKKYGGDFPDMEVISENKDLIATLEWKNQKFKYLKK